jgi:phosphonate degradation associated HDIG domain protein
MATNNIDQIADEIILLYKQKGKANYAGEPVTQLEHACQCAQLAESKGETDEVILAALLHDIGHLLDDEPDTESMGNYGVKDHEEVGKAYLKGRGFSEILCDLVVSHVQAKRYLCAVNKWYYDNLSDASKKTLEFQGGKMNEAEIATFESNPLRYTIIKLRTWDEEAKHPNIPLPDLNLYKTKIINHLRGNLLQQEFSG